MGETRGAAVVAMWRPPLRAQPPVEPTLSTRRQPDVTAAAPKRARTVRISSRSHGDRLRSRAYRASVRRLLVAALVVLGVCLAGGIARASVNPPAPAVAFGFERFSGSRVLGNGANATATGYASPPATVAGPSGHRRALPFSSSKTQ